MAWKRKHDPITGELIEVTEQERAERERVLAERQAKRDAEYELLEALVPSLSTEDEPRVQRERMIKLDARTGAPAGSLLERPRENGTVFHVKAKTYDGFNGNKPKRYVHLSLHFRSGSAAALFRSKGIAIEDLDEARAVHEALGKWIELEAANDAVTVVGPKEQTP